MNKYEVQVCIECKHPSLIKRWSGVAGGSALLDAIVSKVSAHGLDNTFEFRPVACLGNCKHRCRMSVVGQGRWTWIVGDIHPVRDGDDIVEFLQAWLKADKGLIPKLCRSPWLVEKSLGRVPPPLGYPD